MKKVLLLSIAMCFSLSIFAETIKIYTEDTPPLNFKSGDKVTGLSTEIVEAIQKKIGDTSKIEVQAWARALEIVKTEKNTMLYSTTRTPEREKMFKWVGPIASKNWVFFKKAGSPIKIASLDDAKKVKKIGTIANDAKEQFLKEKGFTNMDNVTNSGQNLKKLIDDKIDLWISGDVEGTHTAKEDKIDSSKIEIAFTIKEAFLYLAFNPSTDDAIIKKWSDAFETLKKEKEFEKIHKTWFPNLSVPMVDKNLAK